MGHIYQNEWTDLGIHALSMLCLSKALRMWQQHNLHILLWKENFGECQPQFAFEKGLETFKIQVAK